MNIDQILRSAMKYHQEGSLHKAEYYYKEILKIQPRNSQALYLLGIVYYHLGKFDQTIEYLKKALHVNQKDPNVCTLLGSSFKAIANFDEAIIWYQRAIELNPDSPDVYYNLGNIFITKGQPDEAIKSYQKAIHVNPRFAEAYVNLGNILHEKGQIEEAIFYYQKALELNPSLVDAYYNMGTIFRRVDRLDEAISSFQKALELNPALAGAYYNLGIIFQARKQFDEALACYQRAIRINPQSEDIFNNIGVILQEKGDLNGATDSYLRAIELNPDFSEAYNNLGNLFQEKGDSDKSISCYEKAVQLNPNFAIAYDNLGSGLQEKGEFEKAINCHRKAIELNPDFAAAHRNLGNALQEKGLTDEAIASYRRALQLNSLDAETYSSLGTALQEKGQLNEAMACHQRALEIAPNLTDAHWNMSLTMLLSGNFKEGWEKYEWRFLKKGARPSPLQIPRWDGSSLRGKSLFVFAEQGIGDEIMFASCLPEVINEANLCVVECDKRLIPVFARSFPKVQFIERLKEPGTYPSDLPSVDVKIAIGSLPLLFRSSLSCFPLQKAYLTPDIKKVIIWRKRFKELGTGLKIGISWRGGSKPATKLARSTTLGQWLPLFSVSGVHFINLQYGDCTSELMEAQRKFGAKIHDWKDADPLTDLDNFAAQISALDLVISVDNATVHMAGAIGTPVWALLPLAPDWRWMRDYEDTPWYETVRLYRQKSPGDWESVFNRIESSLKQYLETGRLPIIDPGFSYKADKKLNQQ